MAHGCICRRARGIRPSGTGTFVAVLLTAAFILPVLTASAGVDPAATAGMGRFAGAEGGAAARSAGTPHYFGPYPNYANSPVPKGAVTKITLLSGGEDYTNPVVTIKDMYLTGSGATATAAVENGTITQVNLTFGGSGYSAPYVVITDPDGENAEAVAEIGGPLTGGIRKFVDTLPGLGPDGANNLGNYIPLAAADTAFPTEMAVLIVAIVVIASVAVAVLLLRRRGGRASPAEAGGPAK